MAADRLLDLLEEKYKLLADNPHMGPARPDIAKELRYLPVGNYLLLYRVISNGIELVRVVHGARTALSLGLTGAAVERRLQTLQARFRGAGQRRYGVETD